MPNDIPMLQWAGRSYAVANAHPAVRDVADEVVGSNDEDAVAALSSRPRVACHPCVAGCPVFVAVGLVGIALLTGGCSSSKHSSSKLRSR